MAEKSNESRKMIEENIQSINMLEGRQNIIEKAEERAPLRTEKPASLPIKPQSQTSQAGSQSTQGSANQKK